ncbi:MAG: response regulator [Candidatus Eisenbacteria sp.]|nr:response regulator [Candidatus Eisenbacteria bacterium]
MQGRILIVDDEQAIRRLLKDILEERGHSCVEAENAERARERLAGESFDLVLSDINMPGESGLDLVRFVLDTYEETAAVLVSVRNKPEMIEAALEMGVYGYIVKPFGVEEVLINVAAVLHRRKLMIEKRHHQENLEQIVEERTAALRESEERFRQIADTVEDVFWVGGGGEFRGIYYLSPAFEKIWGRRPEEVYADEEVLWESLHRDDRGGFERAFEEYLRTGEKLRAEFRINRPDGSVRWILARGFAVRNDEGEIYRTVGVLQDITEKRVLESQLIQAQKLESIGQMAAGIAHEINTPTQYVGDNTRFLQEAFEGLCRVLEELRGVLDAAKSGDVPAERIERAESVLEDTDLDYLLEEAPRAFQQTLDGIGRVARIVRAMKEFSHPGGEGMQATDINKAIESTVTVARNEWKYVADLDLKLDPSLPPVPCMPGEFNQVILNLVVNAAQAIDEFLGENPEAKGEIVIETRQDGDWVEVRVADTGGGIPEEVQSRVFNPFFTTKEVGKGSGQGLAIARSVIVDKHRGTLSLETEEGKGATFIIRLPLDGGEEREAESSHETTDLVRR